MLEWGLGGGNREEGEVVVLLAIFPVAVAGVSLTVTTVVVDTYPGSPIAG